MFQLRRVYPSVLLKYLQGLGATYRAIPQLVAYPDISPAFLAATVAQWVACGLWLLLTRRTGKYVCLHISKKVRHFSKKYFALGTTGSDSPLHPFLRGNPSHRPRLFQGHLAYHTAPMKGVCYHT